MKKRVLSNLRILILLFPVIFVSCNKDDEGVRPTISLSAINLVNGIYDADEGELISINVSINAPRGFKILSIGFENISRLPEEIQPIETGQSSFEFNFTMDNWVYETKPFDIVFVAADNENAASEARVTVTPGDPTILLLEDNPDIGNDTVRIFVNQEFQVNVRYTFPAGFGQFRWSVIVNGISDDVLVTSLPPTQGTSVTHQLRDVFGSDFLNQEVSFEFEITDKFNNVANLALPAIVGQKPTAIYTGILLTAPQGDGSSKTFFSSNTGLTYSLQEVNSSSENISQFIDLGYYYGVNDKALFSGPANYPTIIYNLGPNGEDWTNLNVTNFRRTNVTTSQFNALNENSLDAVNEAYDNATGGDQLIITDLQIGEIIAFKTSNQKSGGSKKGLIKIVSITTGTGVDGKIEIEVVANQ